MKKECEFFGVRSSKGTKKMCDKCPEAMFKKCTVETNMLMGTSIVIDAVSGVTKHVLPKEELSEVELMFENSELRPTKKETEKKDKKSSTKKKEKAKTKRVTGISKLCRSLRKQNVSDEDIEVQVAKLYTESGMDTKAAQAKAKSCVAHMVWDKGTS